MTTGQKTFLCLVIFVTGVMVGHFWWGAARIEVTRVSYDIVANSEKCASAGGQIVATVIFGAGLEIEGRLVSPVKYECVVPGKTVEL